MLSRFCIGMAEKRLYCRFWRSRLAVKVSAKASQFVQRGPFPVAVVTEQAGFVAGLCDCLAQKGWQHSERVRLGFILARRPARDDIGAEQAGSLGGG